jgi:hypothetical protein
MLTDKVVIVTGTGGGVAHVLSARPRSAEGWTPESVLSHALPAMKALFSPLDIASQVFTWDPF